MIDGVFEISVTLFYQAPYIQVFARFSKIYISNFRQYKANKYVVELYVYT